MVLLLNVLQAACARPKCVTPLSRMWFSLMRLARALCSDEMRCCRTVHGVKWAVPPHSTRCMVWMRAQALAETWVNTVQYVFVILKIFKLKTYSKIYYSNILNTGIFLIFRVYF